MGQTDHSVKTMGAACQALLFCANFGYSEQAACVDARPVKRCRDLCGRHLFSRTGARTMSDHTPSSESNPGLIILKGFTRA
jgi:hypothetical protein